jgi:myo-inositol-1(or 4)-monophosphatase
MTAIDTEEVLALLREIGAGLCESYWRGEPAAAAAPRSALRHGLTALYPVIGWAADDRGEYWLGDGVDGAAQYARAIPGWTLSLTLVREGVAVFSAVFDAMHDEMFHALWGHGAYCNGRPIRVNGRASHLKGMVATNQPPLAEPHPWATEQAGLSLRAMLPEVQAVRNLGATSLQLAYVACGRLDAFWQFGQDWSNCAGGALLIREAGGVVTQADGAPYSPMSMSIAAAPPGAHASMLMRLQDVMVA